VASPSIAVWQTGTETQRSLRMAEGGKLGGPVALFAGGISPTTAGGSHGVVGGNDLSATVPASSLVVTVAAGQCFIHGTSAAAQGTYYWYQDASSTVTLAAYNTQARTDLLGVWVKDNAEDSSGATSCGLAAVTGTPGAGVPTVPAGFLVLYQAAVPANSGTVVLTNKRPYAAAIGGLIRCNSTLRPTGAALWQGQVIYELDTDRIWAYTGTAWAPVKGRFGCAMGLTSATIGTGTANLTWGTEFRDTDGYSSVGNSVAAVPAGLAGIYDAFLFVQSASVQTAVGEIALFLNGTTMIAANAMAVGKQNFSCGRSIALGAGDTVSAQITNGSASMAFTTVFELYRKSD
jgi:hypothetical protein